MSFLIDFTRHDVQMSKQLKYPFALIALLFISATSLATCTATERNANDSSENGSSNTATISATINAVGDLVAFTGWCYPSCTPVSMTLGSQTAVQTTVSGNPGPGDPGTGQGFIFYILSAAASGTQTVNWTVSGAHTSIQTSYMDFSPSEGCVFTHHVDSPLGTGTGTNINTPSITPTAGDVLFNFTWISQHITNVYSPWQCVLYAPQYSCYFESTVNTQAYVLSASSGSTANNMSNIQSGDSWQALITSFSMKPGGPPPSPPTGLTAMVQ